MKALAVGLLTAIAMALGMTAADRARAEPYQLARSLQMLQDQIVRGSNAALREQPRLLDRLEQEITDLPREKWGEQRNVRALVIFLVNGGSPAAVHKLVSEGIEFGASRELILALIAFAERRPTAGPLLAKIDARTLEPGVGGMVALAQGIAFLKEPAKAQPYFALARLLVPGSLVEEAALRREITLLLTEKKLPQSLELATRYMWRFPSSVYASDVVTYLGESVIPEVAADQAKSGETLRFLMGIPELKRRPLLLSVADESARSGKLQLADLVSGIILQSETLEPVEQQRALVYRALFKAFSDPQNTSMDDLIGTDRERLPPAEQGLVDAALAVAAQVRSNAVELVDASYAPGDEVPAVMLAARKTIAKADEILGQALP